LYQIIGILTIAGHAVYVPRLIRGLSQTAISENGINNWTVVDINDIEDIVVPEDTFGLLSWWWDLDSPSTASLNIPAEIEAALRGSKLEYEKVSNIGDSNTTVSLMSPSFTRRISLRLVSPKHRKFYTK
jgi:hypothetical protein